VSSFPANIAWLIGPLHQYTPTWDKVFYGKKSFSSQNLQEKALDKNE
jgi:hypothetical protein